MAAPTLTRAGFRGWPLWQQALAVALGVMVIIYLGYNYLYKPKISQLDRLTKELKGIEEEIMIAQPAEVVVKEGVAGIALIEKELDEAMKKIPTEAEVPSLLEQFVTAAGRGLDITYDSLIPGGVVAEEKYKRLPMAVGFTGDYFDLNLYLAQLESLPATVRVDQLNIKRSTTSGKLGINLIYSAFVLPGTPAGIAPLPPPTAEAAIATPAYDPFMPKGGYGTPAEAKAGAAAPPAAKKEETLTLKGFWEGKHKKAFINDDLVAVGELISGYRLTRIEPPKVTLSKEGKTKTLRLKE